MILFRAPAIGATIAAMTGWWGGRRATAVLAAALLAFTLFFYRDLLFERRVTVFRDQYTILLRLDWVVRLLSQWNWPPLWTPFQVLGKPLAADPLAAVYYPLNWVAAPAALPARLQRLAGAASRARGRSACTRCCAAAASRRQAAAFGGLLFGFGGLFVAFDNMSNARAVVDLAAVDPARLRRLVRRGRARSGWPPPPAVSR